MSILSELVEVQEAGLMDKARENAGYEPVQEDAMLALGAVFLGVALVDHIVTKISNNALASKCRKAMKEYEEKNPKVAKWSDLTRYPVTRVQMEHFERSKAIQSWLDLLYKQGADGIVRFDYKDDIVCYYFFYYIPGTSTIDRTKTYAAVASKYKKHEKYYYTAICSLEMHFAPPKSDCIPELEALL